VYVYIVRVHDKYTECTCCSIPTLCYYDIIIIIYIILDGLSPRVQNVRHRCTIDYIQPRGIRLYIGFFLYLLTIILYYIIRSQISYTQLILYCYYYTMRMLVFLVIGPTKCFVKRQTRFRNKIHDVYVARILRSIRKIVKFLSETHIKYEFSPSY